MRLLSLAALLVVGPAFAGDGRWQVVNPTPSIVRTIMLLDTQTGETWIICKSDKGSSNWCHVPKTKLRDVDPDFKEPQAATPPTRDTESW